MVMVLSLRTLLAKKGGICHLQTASLPELPYDYGALEPAISSKIMKLHHQTYETNYNEDLEQLDAADSKGGVITVVSLQNAVKLNGGGCGQSCCCGLTDVQWNLF